jgi:hypothetical protein
VNCPHGKPEGDLSCHPCALERLAEANRHGERIPRGSDPLSAKEREIVARRLSAMPPAASMNCPHDKPDDLLMCDACTKLELESVRAQLARPDDERDDLGFRPPLTPAEHERIRELEP